jgi:hypothetical protein
MNIAGNNVYCHGDKIEMFMVITQGSAVFIKPRYSDSIFGVVDAEDCPISKYPLICPKLTLQNIGYEDSIVNHLQLIYDIKNNDFDS